jgi:hypothetical protein
VVFEGARLQVGNVNFPSFGALSAGILLLRLASAIPGENARLRE